MDKIEERIEKDYLNSIVEHIKEILKQAENISERSVRHRFIQNNLISFLVDKDFDAIKEYKVKFFCKYRIRKRFGESRGKRNGLIDIYANFIDLKNKRMTDTAIAIEYDNSASLRWRSIEKLLQSDAQYCFGLIYGAKNKSKFEFYYERSIWKLLQIYKELISQYNEEKEYDKIYKLITKKLWLGMISTGFFKQIDIKDLLSYSFRFF